MSCVCRPVSLLPSPGDTEESLLAKIAFLISEGGSGGVSSISINGGPAQTGAVSINTSSGLLNFTDENSNADGVGWASAGTVEIFRSVGASGFLQLSTARIHRNVDDSEIAILGGLGKSTSAFYEVFGQAHATSPGHIVLTTKGQTAGSGTFHIRNAPNSSVVSVLRAAMTWEGDWQFTPTWNNGATAFVALDVNPTNTSSAAGALLGRFSASSVSQWEVSKTGNTTQLGSVTAAQLRLPNTTSATAGGVYFSAIRAFHNFGTFNTFIGVGAGNLTTTGVGQNVGVGVNALANLTTGESNCAMGYDTLQNTTTGYYNMAVGYLAMRQNTTGIQNCAYGAGALGVNTTGGLNMAVGAFALASNVSGTDNIAIGNSSGYSSLGNRNILIGSSTGTNLASSASNNIFIGYFTGSTVTTGQYNLLIGDMIVPPSLTGNYQLSIGNIIFGTNIDGTGSTVSSGNIGIAISAPPQKFSVLGAGGFYNAFTSSTNFERIDIQFTANVGQIWTEKGSGGGTARDLVLGADATELIHFQTGSKLSFFAATPVVKQTSGENLTNNVTAGGTDGTIANYTDLVIYANDSAAIRNDIYQISRKLLQVNNALRLYGLLT